MTAMPHVQPGGTARARPRASRRWQRVIKPWLFRGWGMDMIGQVYPASSKGHKYILVATDYFTEWIEAVPLKAVATRDVIEFIKGATIAYFYICLNSLQVAIVDV